MIVFPNELITKRIRLKR